jgi:hypothetical protein
MIPYYNTDLTGESNLNVSKRRVMSKLTQTYSQYPEVYMTQTDYKDNKKLESTLNTIFNNMDIILILFSDLIENIYSNGSASEFVNEGEYNIHILSLRDLLLEQLPKLNRALEIFYTNIDNVKLKDFNKLNDYFKEIKNVYTTLKGLVIKDINADNLYDFFKFLEPNVSGYLKGGGRRNGSKNKPKETPMPSENIMRFLSNVRAEEAEKAKKTKKRAEEAEEKEEGLLQEVKEDEDEEEAVQEEQLQKKIMEDVYDYVIDRANLKDKWVKLIDLFESENGIFNKWNELVRIYNEKRPSLRPNPNSSMRQEMEGGCMYDASLPFCPNKYI